MLKVLILSSVQYTRVMRLPQYKQLIRATGLRNARRGFGIHPTCGTVDERLAKMRDPERRDDALCAVCSPETDLDGYLTRARAVLSSLAAEGEG